MNNYLKEIKATIILLAIPSTIYGFAFILSYFQIQNYFYKTLIYYLILCVASAILSSSSKNKLLKKITEIILMPAGFIYILFTISIPFGFLMIHIMYYIAFSVLIPEIFFLSIDYLDIHLVNNVSTLMYLKFTASVFIAVLFNFQLRKLIYKISPARFKSSQKLKPFELDKLTDYLLSENNIRFCIYSLYVVLLLIINIKNFEEQSLSSHLLNDKAILQSFVSFIAFDRSLVLLKQLEFKPSDFLNKIVKSIINKFKDLENINK